MRTFFNVIFFKIEKHDFYVFSRFCTRFLEHCIKYAYGTVQVRIRTVQGGTEKLSIYYSNPGSGVEYCDEHVCGFVLEHLRKIAHHNFTKLSVPVVRVCVCVWLAPSLTAL